MDNQEAIKILGQYDVSDLHFYTTDGEEIPFTEWSDAIEMAISALQAQELKQELKQEVKNLKESSLTQNALDTISRQEAIDALKEHRALYCDNTPDTFSKLSYAEKSRVDELDTAIATLVNLPSAQPEPHWIPISERLPEDGTDCLVSVRCSKKFGLVDMATYSTDLFKVDNEDFIGNRGESGWYYLSSEYGYCKILNVIAWMPEPSPYKEIKDEGFD